MGKKKPFIDRKSAAHFQVVHRSHRDTKFHDEEATPFVLKPVAPSPNAVRKANAGNTRDSAARDVSEATHARLAEELHDILEQEPSSEESDWTDDSEYYEDEDEDEDRYDEYDDDAVSGEESRAPSAAAAAASSSASRVAAADDTEDSRAGKAALFGIFYDDRDYDYLKHLKPMGGAGSTFIPAASDKPKRRAGAGIVFNDDIVAPTTERPRDIIAESTADGGIGLGLDLPDDIREVLAALEDDAYVEEQPDSYFANLAKDKIDSEMAALVAAAEAKRQEEENPDVVDWTMAARIKNLHASSDDDNDSYVGSSSDEDDQDVPPEILALRAERASDRINRGTGTSARGSTRGGGNASSVSSMTSSVLTRTSHLELLDDRFDALEREYADDQLGAVDAPAPPTLSAEQKQFVDALMDEFLTTTSVTTHNTPYENLAVQGGGVGQYEEVRRLMRTDDNGVELPREHLLRKYAMQEVREVADPDEDARTLPKIHLVEDKYANERWDCESILSTYSNLDNHPAVISERGRRTRRVPKAGSTVASSVAGGAPPTVIPASGRAAAAAAKPLTPSPLAAMVEEVMASTAAPIRLSARTGLPMSSAAAAAAESDDDAPRQDQDSDDSDEEDEMVEAVNLGAARSKYEDRDDKRARKQALKDAKRDRRAAKKELKTAFKQEDVRQTRVAIVKKQTAKGVTII
ncbi:hypothetical protein BC828DRAFT_387576 [Blastocladiella britannica]|nr:hypothetical protein BC828DRAFT_387576 [Blastocladiella britannica]